MVRYTLTTMFIKCLWLVNLCTTNIHATTHWMVTETGLIQPREDSPFVMSHPYDLISFLNQDTRWINIHNLYHDLWRRQQVINKMWKDVEKNADYNILLSKDKNCVKISPLRSLDWDIAPVDVGKNLEKSIPEEDLLLYSPSYGHDTEVPDCKKISSLTFSMFAFEHLKSMMNRVNLTGSPEYAVPTRIATIMTTDQFGHWVTNSLRKNTTSWLHYNLASLYWKTRGDVPRSVECSRRAVLYAPRYYKDVALLNLGVMLHKSQNVEDAITVLGAAVDHDPKIIRNHYALANAYAVEGDFNSAIKHYDICLKLNPKFKNADTHRNGVLCHKMLIKKMLALKQQLYELQENLVEFSNREAIWLNSQTAFLKTMKHDQDIDFYKNVETNCAKMEEITGLQIKELKKLGNKNHLIKYFFDRLSVNPKWQIERGVHAIDWVFNIQKLMFHLQMQTELQSDYVYVDNSTVPKNVGILKEIGPLPLFPDIFPEVKGKFLFDDSDEKPATPTPPPRVEKKSTQSASKHLSEFETGIVLYPSTMKVSRNTEDFDRESDWPSTRLCEESASTVPDNLEAIFPVFLPFENKGIQLKSLLTHKIGVPADVEHDVPWHPPTCALDKTAAFSKKSQKQQITIEVQPPAYLRRKLLHYAGDGDPEVARHMQEAEIGQRIYAVMQKKLAPKWIVYTLASLYWRVRGNNINALNCLLPASKIVENKYKDVVLLSLSSVYLEMGYFDEALAAAEAAFRIGLYEPATNFQLSQLNMVKKHRNTHVFHLKQTLRAEPQFMSGVPRALLLGWACLLKRLNSVQDLDFGEGDYCTQVEPGMSMVCEKDGSNCHVTNIQCFSNKEKDKETSTIVRMLEKRHKYGHRSSADVMNDAIFNDFIQNMPVDRADVAAHEKNFRSLLKVIHPKMEGCGSKGCTGMTPEDLGIKEEECTFQDAQLAYWLHIFSFRELLEETNSNLPQEIASITPSNKKVPECRIYSDTPDFFLEKMSRVDTEGWDPMLSLMHQFAEVFNLYDYIALGAKIAKYMESKPRSWTGAVAAAWWCGAGGRGACAARCSAAALSLAPRALRTHALRPLAAMLHLHSKLKDGKEMAYLSFYLQPKHKVETFLLAVSHSYLKEYEEAVWLYRYTLTLDPKFAPAKACLHATMCVLLYGNSSND
ncbi:tetratricopeptide repeat protein 17 [Plodia interpunctella]|uniref:tetratricopeptide repeat protein 17 n=1 Tax=Plodia interpunctella TaxID=58824 RepID=UPI002367BADB|nr:tetratricopeptide repeat protein 17 [Plodia interpunctella]